MEMLKKTVFDEKINETVKIPKEAYLYFPKSITYFILKK